MKQKSVPPSHIVRIYSKLTSTKSVLRLTCTRLARAEILTFLVGLVERRVKKRKSSAFEAEFNFEVGQSVGSLRSPPDPKTALMSSTEFIKLGLHASVKGPDLPFTISGHSMIQYDEKTIYIIGGVQNGSISNKTWIVDPTNEFQITEGPSLNKGRYSHGCAKMTLNGRTILVVAGGFGAMDSVEILDPLGNNVWTQGLYLKSITVENFDYKSHFIFQDQIYHCH